MAPLPDAPSGASGSAGLAAPPPDPAELLLIRHGAVDWAVPGAALPFTSGHADPPLSELGHRQAALLAQRLATAHIDALYITPLQRTAQTAAPLAELLHLTPLVEADLREVHLGEWEGVYAEKVARQDPLVAEVFALERRDVIPGAEPAALLAARVRGAVNRLAAAHPGQRIAVVSHGGVIAQALAEAARSRPFAFLPPGHSSVSRLVVADGQWIVRSFNDLAHLEEWQTH